MEEIIKNVHSGHRQRLRDKIATDIFEQVPDHEFLESILFFVIPRKNMNPLAHKLLKDFGTLQNIFLATKQQLMQTEGISEITAQFLITLPKLCRRLNTIDEVLKYYVTSNDFTELFTPYFEGVKSEQMCVALTRDNASLIAVRALELGSTHNIDLNINKIVEMAIKHNARNIIIAHNHPFNLSKPSTNDIENTVKLAFLLDSLNIKLLDHIIFGGDGTTSIIHDVEERKKEYKKQFSSAQNINILEEDKNLTRRNEHNFSHLYDEEEYLDEFDIDTNLIAKSKEDFAKQILEYSAQYHKDKLGETPEQVLFTEEELKELDVVGEALKKSSKNDKQTVSKQNEKITNEDLELKDYQENITDIQPIDKKDNLKAKPKLTKDSVNKQEKHETLLKEANNNQIKQNNFDNTIDKNAEPKNNITTEQELLDRLKNIARRHSKGGG